MAEESKALSTSDIDAQIKILKEQKKKLECNSTEKFSICKFSKDFLGLLDPVSWAKWFITFIKTLLVLSIIAGLIFGYGYWKGRKKTINSTPIKIELDYGKEAMIQLDKEGKSFMHITKDGEVHVQDSADDKLAKIHYIINAKDVPAVWEKLKPYGFDLHAFLAAGGSIGSTGAKAEVGVGMQWYRFYKANINSFITSVGFYPIGIGYKLTDNIDALLGGGYGYKGDQRVFLGIKAKF
jgi:hypothetical protein